MAQFGQYGAVTGRRRKNPARDMINAQLPYLPNMIAAKQDREMREKSQKLADDQFVEQKRFNEDQMKMAEKQYAHQKQVEKAHMGLSAGKMGLDFLSGKGEGMLEGLPFFGRKKKTPVGAVGGTTMWGSGEGSPSGKMKLPADMTSKFKGTAGTIGSASPAWEGLKSSFGTGTTLAPGMLGFGVGSLMPKKKMLGMGIGAGLGALTGFAKGGGWGSLWGGLSGGLGAGLSSLF